MDLSIIVVNWNSAGYLRACLESIRANGGVMKYEVIVIDNASFDGSRELIENDFPWVTFIQSSKNRGFAKANNLGFRHALGRNLLFLNPDTEVTGPALNTMLTHMESLPDAGAIGCKLLNSDLSVQTSCIQPFPTILNQVLDVGYLKLKFPRFKLWGIAPLMSSGEEPQVVDVISGACLMIKRHVFEEVGMFCEDYFMYSDDVELCFRVRRSGYRCYYIGAAQVIHHGGRSAERKQESHFGTILMRESRYIYLSKTKGRAYAWLYRVSMTLVSIWRLMVLLFLSPLMFLTKKQVLFCTLRKWARILRWTLGLEKWAKALSAAD